MSWSRFFVVVLGLALVGAVLFLAFYRTGRAGRWAWRLRGLTVGWRVRRVMADRDLDVEFLMLLAEENGGRVPLVDDSTFLEVAEAAGVVPEDEQ